MKFHVAFACACLIGLVGVFALAAEPTTKEATGRVIGVRMVTDDDQIMIVSSGGKVVRMRVNEIRVIGRNTQGVRLISLESATEKVSKVGKLPESSEGEDPLAGVEGAADVSSAPTDEPAANESAPEEAEPNADEGEEPEGE